MAAKLQIKSGQRVRLINALAGFPLDANTVREGMADAMLLFVRDSADLTKHEASGPP